jgi:hypothetical protein
MKAETHLGNKKQESVKKFVTLCGIYVYVYEYRLGVNGFKIN